MQRRTFASSWTQSQRTWAFPFHVWKFSQIVLQPFQFPSICQLHPKRRFEDTKLGIRRRNAIQLRSVPQQHQYGGSLHSHPDWYNLIDWSHYLGDHHLLLRPRRPHLVVLADRRPHLHLSLLYLGHLLHFAHHQGVSTVAAWWMCHSWCDSLDRKWAQ